MEIDTSFDDVTPDVVLTAVETVLDVSLDGMVTPFASYVNRVYGLRRDDGTELVVKFYRRGRWSEEAIEDEHRFLFELAEAELPVVPPIRDSDGDSLFEVELEAGDGSTGIYPFAVFPKRGGRGFDAEADTDWFRLGALVGRVHQIGAQRPAPSRWVLDPVAWTGTFVEELIGQEVVHPEYVEEFRGIAEDGIARIAPLFVGVPTLRIHGDCHRGNILERGDEGLLLIDFDDMMVGPAVQDLWLLLPDHAAECTREFNLLRDGYEQFHHLDPGEIDLIEPLRFMRMIHFLAWRARQRHDEWFRKEFPEWGNRAFWMREMEDLKDQARYF